MQCEGDGRLVRGALERPERRVRCLRAVALALGLALLAPLALAGGAHAAFGPPSFGAPQAIDAQPPFESSSPIAALACGSPTTCISADASVHVTLNAGSGSTPTWSQPVSNGPGAARSASCPTATSCLVMQPSGAVFRSNDAGVSWLGPQQVTSPNAAVIKRSVSCASDGTCGLVTDGSVHLSTDGGVTWHGFPALFGGGDLPTRLTCVTGGICVAVSARGRVTISTDARSASPTWTTTRIAGSDASPLRVNDVSCVAPASCVAVDAAGNAIASDDVAAAVPVWSTVATGAGGALSAVSCVPAGLCVGVDVSGNALISVAPVSASPVWTMVPTGASTALTAVACVAGGWCVVGDQGSFVRYATVDALAPATTRWSEPVSLNGTTSVNGVSCTRRGLCVAVDAKGRAVISRDRGMTWAPAAAADVAGGRLSRVSCVDSGGGTCVAVNADSAFVAASLAQGAGAPAWAKTKISRSASGGFPGDGTINAVSCAEGGLCVAVTSFGVALISSDIQSGTPWVPIATGAGSLNGVSCPVSTLCVAVDGAGRFLRSRNAATGSPGWSAPALVDGTGTGAGLVSLVDVSCTASALCAAVDSRGSAVSSADATAPSPVWSAPVDVGVSGISRISCAGAGLCVVAGNGKAAYSTSPAAGSPGWTTAVSGSARLTDVSCAVTGACVAVDARSGSVAGVSAVGRLALSASSLAFGDAVAGTSATRAVTVTNSGGAPLNVSGVSRAGGDADGYAIASDACSGASLAPGGQCSIAVSFVPGEVGPYSRASVQIVTDDASSPHGVALSGTGTEPPVAAPPPGPPPPPPAPPPPPPAVPARPSNVVRVTSIAAARGGTITIKVKVPGAGRLALASSSKVRRGKAKKASAITYGLRASPAAKRASTITVRIKPGRVAAAALRRARKLRVTVTVTFTPTGGTRRTSRAGVTVRRA